MQHLRSALALEPAYLDVSVSDVHELYGVMVDRAQELGLVPAEHRDKVLRELAVHEAQTPSAIGRGVAVPHVYLDDLEQAGILFFRLRSPVFMGALDGTGTRYVFFLVGPSRLALDHLNSLASIARVMSDEAFCYRLERARQASDLIDALDAFVRREREGDSRPPPGDNALERTGRLFGGIMRDVRRRLPSYRSDFVDGLHPKSVSAIGFMLFACLAPAVTFGGVMAAKTGGAIGTTERLAAIAVCGTLYALFSGQPLIILGGTGPMLVLTTLLYSLCEYWGLPFLPMYGWIGLWSALFLGLMAILDVSAWMRWFTRFTNEVFAGLISLIFIVESVSALRATFADPATAHDSALLTLVLALGTLYVGYTLGRFRDSRYLSGRAREFLADFGPTIAMVLMSLVALRLHEVDLATLQAPDRFSTTSGRPWLVGLGDVPVSMRLLAAGPAVLVAILVYLDQNITARIVNAPDRHLRKGAGYHLDLGLVSVLMAFCSLFGLPWLVAATVRSLNHVHSLTTERGRQIVHVRETRITALAVHVLIAISLFALPLLKLIPMAVLYGLFLMMGVNSMHGNQFLDRVKLWLMDPDRYPPYHYVGRVRMSAIRKFTFVQAICLSVLWAVKVSPLGLMFPVFIAALVPLRLWLARFFKDGELAELDAESAPHAHEAGDADADPQRRGLAGPEASS